MTEQPERKNVLHFPCEFPLKVIGLQADDFEGFVLEIVRRHVPDLDDHTISRQLSSKGKYLSVAMEFTAQSRAQVDALYKELSKQKRVKWVL